MYSHALATESQGAFDLFNGRNGVDLIDALGARFVGVIPSLDVSDLQARIYCLYRAGKIEEATDAFKEIGPLMPIGSMLARR